MKVELYQTNNSELLFMSFDKKTMDNEHFNLKNHGYKKVLELDYQFKSNERYVQLEELFLYLNRDDRPLRTQIRSMSISDIVIIDGDAYYCDSVGFQSLKIEHGKERGDSYRIR